MVFVKGQKMNLGKKFSDEVKKKMSLSHLGHKRTKASIEKQASKLRGIKRSPEIGQKISLALKGKPRPDMIGHKLNVGRKQSSEEIEKRRQKMIGKKCSLETRKKISESHKRLVEKGIHHAWKGGIYKIHESIRDSVEYKWWRISVFERDNYTCIWCGQKGGQLQVDHIKRFADYPELRFAIDNGRTLCIECHRTTDTFGNRKL